MLITFASVGIGAALVASVIAFVPACIYILPLVWLDRYDPEPLWLLALAFAWGALVAVVVSFVVNTILGAFLGDAFSAVVSAPVFEEGSKGLGLVVLLIFFRRYFDDILDGIIFAGVIALGFATVENVLYYGRGIREGGSDALIVLFVLRGIMSPFAHVTFTSMTGIGCGIARESHNTIVRIIMPINSGDRIQFGRGGIEATVNLETDQHKSEAAHIKSSFQTPPNVQFVPANQAAVPQQTD